MTDGLDILYVGSSTQVQQRLFKWLPWVDLDIFNSKVKYGKMLIRKKDFMESFEDFGLKIGIYRWLIKWLSEDSLVQKVKVIIWPSTQDC